MSTDLVQCTLDYVRYTLEDMQQVQVGDDGRVRGLPDLEGFRLVRADEGVRPRIGGLG